MEKFEIKEYDVQSNRLAHKILERSGIENPDLYLRPDEKYLQSPYIYTGIQEGATQLVESLEADANIGILVDPDVDGLTSATILHTMILDFFIDTNIRVFHHSRNAHGLTDEIMEQVLQSDIELLLLPDSSSNDYKQQQELVDNGIKFIIIDHHLIEDESQLKHGIVINNQRSDNKDSNPNLSGAGMALKFSQVFFDTLGITNDLPDVRLCEMAALGQIGDMLNMADPEIRYIVDTGLRNSDHPMIKAIIDNRIKHVKYNPLDYLTALDAAFYISPLINAVARVGTIEEKELLYDSFVNRYNNKTYTVERRRKINGKFKQVKLEWDAYQYTYDIIQKVKNRQDNMSKKLESSIETSMYLNGGIAVGIFDDLESDERALLGLTANKLVKSLDKPVILLREHDGAWHGSGRGDEMTLESLKDWCSDTGKVIFAKGHDNAFGIAIDDNNIEEFIAETLTVEPMDIDNTVEYVDVLFDKPVPHDIETGHMLRGLFSRDVDTVKYGFKDISFNKEFVRKRGSITTLWNNGVEFIIFGDNEKVYNQIHDHPDSFPVVDIVGEPKMQYWNENGKHQVIVSRIQVQ